MSVTTSFGDNIDRPTDRRCQGPRRRILNPWSSPDRRSCGILCRRACLRACPHCPGFTRGARRHPCALVSGPRERRQAPASRSGALKGVLIYRVLPMFPVNSVTHVPGCSVLKCENLLSYRLWKVDERELPLVKEVILSALVDNPHEVVFGRARVG